jgi:hypothetical protein
MLEDYLDDGNITVDNLLADGKFVNFDGKRYASDRRYERKLRNMRNTLIRNYPCLSNNIDPENYINITSI